MNVHGLNSIQHQSLVNIHRNNNKTDRNPKTLHRQINIASLLEAAEALPTVNTKLDVGSTSFLHHNQLIPPSLSPPNDEQGSNISITLSHHHSQPAGSRKNKGGSGKKSNKGSYPLLWPETLYPLKPWCENQTRIITISRAKWLETFHVNSLVASN